MAITKLFPEFLSNSSIQFAPRRTFITASWSGVTGSINVIVNRSHTQKDNIDMREGLTNEEGPQKFDENTFEGRRKQIYEGKKTPVGSGEIFSEATGSYNYDLQLGLLLDGANPNDANGDRIYDNLAFFPPEYFKKEYAQLNLNFAHSGYSDLPMHPRNAYTSSIQRFVPGTDFLHRHFRRKEIVRRVLDSAYRVGRPSPGWGYTNYSCINMFATTHSTGSDMRPAIVYDSPSDRYLPTTEMQIEFFLKMQNQPTGSGTILHLPGAFAVSVVSGSGGGNVESNGLPLNYRLLLQLGTEANIDNPPSGIDLTVDNLSKNVFAKAVITIAALPGNSETLSIAFGAGNPAQVITFTSGGSAHDTTFSSNAATVYRGTASDADGTAAAIATLANSVTGYSASASGAVVTITADIAVKATHDFIVTNTLGVAPTVSLIRGSSSADTSYFSKDFITASYWHHCCMRWSPSANNRTGSFVIDGRSAGYFEPPPAFKMTTLQQQVDALFLGAYYTGTKPNAKKFFANAANIAQGVEKTTTSAIHPVGSFVNGLDGGEFHEVKISNKIRSLGFVRKNMFVSTGSSDEHLFHLPVLYTPNAPRNNYSALVGDLYGATDSNTAEISLTDFYENYPVPNRASFDSPFNTHHANVGGFLNINVQAFLRDFATGKFPYLHLLSSSVRAYSSCHEMSASDGYSRFPEHKQRNLLILPCDNGAFTQKYESYAAADFSGSIISEALPAVCKVNRLGDFTTNFDSKLCLVDEGWNYSVTDKNKSEGHGPIIPAGSVGAGYRPQSRGFKPPTVPSTRFFDPQEYGLIGSAERSSNMVAFFNVPTLFYGNRIAPGSLEMKSSLYVMPEVSGSDRLIHMRLIDDGYGNIVRANTSGSIAMNNFVGSVYYEDGIIALKSPHLYMVGEEHYEITFKGEQNIHMFEIMVPCSKTLYNSSSNPNYAAYAPSDRVNETATDFVYLSGVNFHDSNMNIVAKARFSQPLVKRKEDEFLIRIKFDF